MRVIDAHWERRNLGLSSQEIIVDDNDKVEDVLEVLQTANSEYVVISLPKRRKDLYDLMADYHYSFIEEAAFTLQLDILKYSPPGPKQDILTRLSYTINHAGARERVENEIKKGMYTTDRISVDPYFSREDTINRYLGFLSDELSRGAVIIEFECDKVPIGYACTKKTGDTTWHQSLVGMYEQSRGKGLGYAFVHLQVQALQLQGAHTISTVVSSNNMASLHVHTKNGFLPMDTRYIFVRHFTGKG